MLNAIIETLGKKSDAGKTDIINIIPGFDTTIGNINEVKRILKIFGINFLVLADYSNTLDSPLNGEYKLYPDGATKLEDVKNCVSNKAAIAMQKYSTKKNGGNAFREIRPGRKSR